MGFVSNLKDRLIEKQALASLNSSLFEPYGRATYLRLNSTAKSVELELVLKGEADPVQIQLRNYQLVEEGDAAYLVIKEVQTSREWLTAVADRFLVNRRLKLPRQAAGLLLRLL